MSSSSELPPDAPSPRHCHLIKIPEFEGYGFNLHAEKSKPGQFIGKVDEGSPAELAGLIEGDRIIEVNGVNIANENHKQVVERIKMVPNETKLLVVDKETDNWYQENKFVVKSTQSNVKYLKTPTAGDNQNQNGQVQQQNGQVAESPSEDAGDMEPKTDPEPKDTKSELPADAPAPRLCHIVKWPDFDGYGFNLHAEKNRPGQFIGKVDENSPAETANLREGDRIVEVNGANILEENHRQIVERIKKVPNETKLLVVDEAAENWYRERNIPITGSLPNVVFKKTPPTSTSANETPVEEKAVPKQMANGTTAQNETLKNGTREVEKTPVVEDVPKASPVESAKENGMHKEETVKENEDNNIPAPDPIPEPPKEVPSTNITSSTSSDPNLNLNMSASEMRQLLAQRKKHDPKKVQMDLRKKYELVEQM